MKWYETWCVLKEYDIEYNEKYVFTDWRRCNLALKRAESPIQRQTRAPPWLSVCLYLEFTRPGGAAHIIHEDDLLFFSIVQKMSNRTKLKNDEITDWARAVYARFSTNFSSCPKLIPQNQNNKNFMMICAFIFLGFWFSITTTLLFSCSDNYANFAYIKKICWIRQSLIFWDIS